MNNLKKAAVFFLVISTSCNSTKNVQSAIAYTSHVVDKPIIFAAGIVSTKEASVFDICFTPNGKTVFFTRRIGNEKQKLWQATFENNVWTNPVLLPFSTDRDETPFLSSDGKMLYFGSARPIEGRPSKGKFDMNIWQVEWSNNQWGVPKPLSSTINAVQQEKEDWPSSNENFIF
jgi:Tol biopolymer transport system component